MNNRKILVGLLIFLSLCINSFAVFEKRIVMPKTMGLCGSGVAVPYNSEGLYINPATFAYSDESIFSCNYNMPFGMQDYIKNFNFNAGILTKKYGFINLGFEGFYTEGDGGKKLSSENKITFSHSMFLMKDVHSSLAVGYNLNLYNLDLGDGQEKANTFGLDLGLMASIYEKYYGGIFVNNINQPKFGSDMTYDLPQSISVGAVYKPYNEIMISFETEYERDLAETIFKGGLEYSVTNYFKIRGGVQTNPASFSCGFSVKHLGMEINYGFMYHPILDNSHSIGITYYLNKSF